VRPRGHMSSARSQRQNQTPDWPVMRTAQVRTAGAEAAAGCCTSASPARLRPHRAADACCQYPGLSADGQERPLPRSLPATRQGRLKPRAYFGVAGVLHGGVWPASVVARNCCELYGLSKVRQGPAKAAACLRACRRSQVCAPSHISPAAPPRSSPAPALLHLSIAVALASATVLVSPWRSQLFALPRRLAWSTCWRCNPS
jgi:hypothetical protein